MTNETFCRINGTFSLQYFFRGLVFLFLSRLVTNSQNQFQLLEGFLHLLPHRPRLTIQSFLMPNEKLTAD